MRTRSTLYLVLASVVSLGVLAGCTFSSDVEATVKRDVETSVAALERSRLPDEPLETDTVHLSEDIWLGEESFKAPNGDELPAQFLTEDGITIVGSRAVGLLELGEQIGKLTQINVRLADELSEEAEEAAEATAPSNNRAPSDWAAPGTMIVSYSGPLDGLLDEVSGRFRVWWKYEDGEIWFYRLETRSFTMFALPTISSIKGAVDGSSDDSGAGLEMTNGVETLDAWDSLTQSLNSLVTGDSTFVIDTVTGTVAVTATPVQMKKVAKFINEQNRRLSRMVAFSAKILQVDLTDEDRYGLDLKGTFSANSALGLAPQWRSPFTSPEGNPGLSLVVADTATAGDYRNWHNSGAIIDALSTQGHVSLMTSASVTTMNNKPAPVMVSRTENYISSLTLERDDLGNSITTETAQLDTGFTMEVLPRVLDHGRLLIMFNMTLKEAIDYQRFETEGGELQLPIYETRGFVQEVAMRSGQTLILSGFESVSNSINKTGTGNADFNLLGGLTTSSRTRSVLVVLVTPEVLQSPLVPESRIRGL